MSAEKVGGGSHLPASACNGCNSQYPGLAETNLHMISPLKAKTHGPAMDGPKRSRSRRLAMGMMMVSPVMISLPLKLFLFVMVDGWTRLIRGLVLTYT